MSSARLVVVSALLVTCTRVHCRPSAVFYDPQVLEATWKSLFAASASSQGQHLSTLPTYLYDIVDVSRQVPTATDALHMPCVEQWVCRAGAL